MKTKESKIILKGTGASAGEAEGIVKIITKKENLLSFKKGEILVAKITDPSYVMIMTKSSAIITDTGGLMSHPSIVARELGVPCIVATKYATSILKNGQKIKVDGTNGIIYESK